MRSVALSNYIQSPFLATISIYLFHFQLTALSYVVAVVDVAPVVTLFFCLILHSPFPILYILYFFDFITTPTQKSLLLGDIA